jgi:hypothetical protein
MMDIEKLKQHLETIRLCEYEAGMCDDDGTMEEESEQKKALALTCSNEIISEWEAMEKRIAELVAWVERLQWHYRKDGLLPVEGGVLFVTEGDEYIWMGYYKNGLFYDSDGDTTMPKYVARWKYID